jgi:ComF family protein
MVDGWLFHLERALFAPHCILCGGAGSGRDLCAGCAADLPYNAEACPRCALPAAGGRTCGACLARPPAWDAAFSLLRYDPPGDELLKALKFGRRLAIGRVLGELMAERLGERPRPDRLIPMPLHPARECERGFNQAIELARPVARALDVPLDSDICRRVRATAAQSGLDLRARRRNVRGAFALRRRLAATHVAIVDDIVTTGATAAALAQTLRRAGAARIELWSAARALRPA